MIWQLLESFKERKKVENAEELWNNEVKDRNTQYKEVKISKIFSLLTFL